MLALKYLLIAGGLGMILVAVSILGYDLYRELLYRRALAVPASGHGAAAYRNGAGALRWRWRCWRGDRSCWRSALWWCRAAWRAFGSAR